MARVGAIALFTSTSMRPNASAAVATSASRSSAHADVAAHRERAAARRFDRGHGLGDRAGQSLGRRVDGARRAHDGRARGREAEREPLADAARRAGDDRDLSVECHRATLRSTATARTPRVPRMEDSVTVHMDATPEAVWALVSDVTQIGRYSPETFEAEWLDGATGPAVGARFRGHVKRNGIGPVYWTTCSVTECEPGRVFAFGVGAPGKAMNTWSYRLEPAAGGGTDVTESFRLSPVLPLQALLGGARLGARTHEPRRHAHDARAHQGRGRSDLSPDATPPRPWTIGAVRSR